MDRHWQRWTGKDVQELRSLAEEGASQREAAEEMGRTWRAVRSASVRYGVKFKPGPDPNPVTRMNVLRLIGEGHSLSGAARVLGVRHSRVWVVLQRLFEDGLVRKVPVKTVYRYEVVKEKRNGDV